ncbi:MAG TPA: carboxypeptidase-like regulatory domain-containing protein, partial [Candidatus Binataceae bacterium]|nr:carboxypeptidase-like regulatory domain-containing protein [Candidatus Binataceae bacterium]
MPKGISCISFLILLSTALVVPANLTAQVDRGSIVGAISDPTGARVAGAQVTVTNRETNQATRVTSDDAGNYKADLLRIGTYSVSVEKAGFQRAVQNSVEVAVNQSARVDFALRLGSVNQTTEVNAAPPLLETEASSLGTIETERRISSLPLNGRDFIQLAYLGPGANGGQTGSNVKGGVFENERANEAVSVNGLRVSNNNFLLNGVDNNEFGLGGVIVLPAPDAIQEFRTEENSMSAEFGRGGAAVNVVLKSGTNQVHGGVYEFIRNDKLDAVNYFNQGQQPFKRNQFGAFLGGPIKKNKTFIFGDYQGSRLRESQPFLSTVPSDAERVGNFSDRLTQETFSPCGSLATPATTYDTGAIFNPLTTKLATCSDGITQVLVRDPFPGNIIPLNATDRVGLNVASFYPHANLPGLTNNYLANQNHLNDQDQFDVRLDHRFRDEDQIFASYSFGDVRSQRPGPLGPLFGGSDCC